MISKKSKSTKKKAQTLESLAQRLDAVEQALSLHQNGTTTSTQDWWDVVGISKGSKILPLIEAEGKAIRERERAIARKKK
ncbi:MAG: hypothetical protein QM703_12030 [Gemmatales bacterium]